MSLYAYTAKDRRNQRVKGYVEALSDELAVDLLNERGLTIIELATHRQREGLGLWSRVFDKPKTKDLVVFFRQLATLVSANVPIVRSLRLLVDQTSRVSLKVILTEIADEVEGGSRLSKAMERYPTVFNAFVVNIIQASETAGRLDETLTYLADRQEKDYDVAKRFYGALIYPGVVLALLFVVGFLVAWLAVPKFLALLEFGNVEPPLPTRILIAVSSFLEATGWFWVLLMIFLVIIARLWVRTEAGRASWDHLKLRIPILGKLWHEIALVRIARSLSTLVVGGVPLTESLMIVKSVVGNAYYEALLDETAREVEEGNSLATAFERDPLVPPMFPQMIATGEQTGKLESILDKLSTFYTKEVDYSLANLIAVVQPAVIIILGIGVFVLVAAVIMPAYSLAAGSY